MKDQSVLKKADARGYMTELDARYLAHELSSDADGVIAKSERWREQVYKMGECWLVPCQKGSLSGAFKLILLCFPAECGYP